MTQDQITLEGTTRRGIERRVLSQFADQFANLRVDITEADATTKRIARAYGRAWKVARGTARDMSTYAAEQMHSGRGLSARDVAQLDRVDRATHALERQIRDLSQFAGVEVKGAVSRTLESTVDTVLSVLSERTGLERRFTTPSQGRMEALVLRSADRIESATRRLSVVQATALKDGLIRGLILGENPRETARHIYRETEGVFFGGLSRANTIVRTETADANRYAAQVAYNASDMVVGWKWMASLSARTCPACWSMHNTFHEKTEIQYGHQNCRCTMVPVLADDEPTDHDLGDAEAIFWGLDREDQLAIMGPGRLKALEGGAPWVDLSHLRHNPDWRPSVQTTRVSDMQGLAELQVATFPGDVITVPGFTNASLMSMAFAQGGMTVQTASGAQPTSGYVVARDANSEVIDAREFFGPAGPTTVAAWMTRHGDLLDEPGAHMGLWYDTANGKVVLDIVQVIEDRDAAIALGKAENQIAIFDLNTFTEIATGGDGGYLTSSLTAAGTAGTLSSALDAKGIPVDQYDPYADPRMGSDAARMVGDWMDAKIDDPTLADTQVQWAFDSYQSNGYGDINDFLRNGPSPYVKAVNVQPDIDLMDRAFDRLRLPTSMVVHRGMDLDDMRKSLGDDLYTRIRDSIEAAKPTMVPLVDPKVGDVAYWNGRKVTITRGLDADGYVMVHREGDADGFALPLRPKYLTAGVPGEADLSGLVGKVHRDAAYLSTSFDPGSTVSFQQEGFVDPDDPHVRVRMDVIVPAGYPAVPVELLTGRNYHGEDEILLDRGTSLRIEQAVMEGGVLVLRATVVPRTDIETALSTGSFASGGDKPTGDDVGRTVTWKDGTFRGVGEVVDVFPTGSTRVRDSSGREHTVWPDQILTIGHAEQIKSDTQRLAEIAETGKRVHGVDVNYVGTSPQIAEKVDTNLRDLRLDWPEIEVEKVRVGDAGGAFAVTGTSFPFFGGAESKIDVASDYAQDPKRWQADMARAESRGHFHGGTSDEPQEYTIDHEFGHVIDFRLFGHPQTPDGFTRRLRVFADVLNAVAEKWELSARFSNDIDQPTGGNADVVMNAANSPLWRKLIERDLSGYALQSPQELFAEAYAVYRDHGPGVSVVADAVMRQMVTAYEDEFGYRPNERDLDVLMGEVGS